MNMPDLPRRRRILPAVIVILLMAGLQSLAAPVPQVREDAVEKLLTQGDTYYRQGKYSLAIGTYLEAAGRSKSPLNLSAAYFGLSLCCFYQRDSANSLKWIRRTLGVDPNKEISSTFYPQAFYRLFQQGRQEMLARNKTAALPAAEDAAKPAPRIEPPPATVEERPAPVIRRENPPADERANVPTRRDPAPLETAAAAAVAEADKGGHWEINGHYSHWTVNPVISIFKGTLTDKLANEIQNEIDKKLRSSHAGLVSAQFSPNLTLNSSGTNYGLELRYFTTGWAGTFSIGAAIESTQLSLSLSGTPQQIFTNGTVADAVVSAELKTVPLLTTNFNFRWEIGRGRLRPYFVFGLGFGKLDGTFSYSYSGTYRYSSLQEEIPAASATKDFATLSEDIDFKIPKMFVILQLHFGLKLELIKGASLLAEAGIWDGLLLRGGLAFRF
jgi:tetratricopeptide (TPR) repeat protein